MESEKRIVGDSPSPVCEDCEDIIELGTPITLVTVYCFKTPGKDFPESDFEKSTG